MTEEASSFVRAMEAEAGERIGFRFFADPEQLDLLRDDKGKLPADALRQERVGQERRGPGRRPGSQNKASKDLARYFVGKYGDPIDALGEIMNTPVDVLYAQMVLAQGGESKSKRITGYDAMKFKRDAIVEALPYIHGKQATKIELTKRADVILNIEGMTDPAALMELTGTPELGAEELERIEFVPGVAAEVVEGEVIGDE